ncbi:flagellar motor switch protein FliG [Paracraurococcus lichenis]|uniref:Flagellar motor switch protein FliG n=1 Tax=Paracraurococcus lichenis TaxID=3064888 RepID=A0ABT9EB16_9PROT|nr:flagellar motor switch protein FliG [Paracraurococcus sp. LOR1-02]MDO9713402.1 flagellar motor switch protein FliG [Paracraurococcus sp. LOR1-02]
MKPPVPYSRNGQAAAPAPEPQGDALSDAAVVLMVLDEQRAHAIFERFEENEIRRASRAMANLGKVPIERVETVLARFQAEVGKIGTVIGTAETTERLLRRLLPQEKVSDIMDEIRGPEGKTMWEKLANISPEVLATYLRTELAQTAAVILSKLPAQHAARVLALLPETSVDEIILRMVRMDSIQKHVLNDIETTLQREFITNLSRSYERDSSQIVAEILNRADKGLVGRLMSQIENREPHAASRIKRIMFTFDDLVRVDRSTFGTLVAECPAERLQLALTAAAPELRELFFGSMSQRAAAQMREEVENTPPQRRKSVEDAQADIISIAKRLADDGRIIILEEDEAELG